MKQHNITHKAKGKYQQVDEKLYQSFNFWDKDNTECILIPYFTNCLISISVGFATNSSFVVIVWVYIVYYIYIYIYIIIIIIS